MEVITTLAQELRQTLRRLRQAPRFTWLAILMLGLALGAHLAVVSVIDTVLLRPVPEIESDRLFAVHETRDGDGFRSLAYADFLEYRTQTRTFEELAAHYSTARLHVGLGGSTEMLNGAIVSANYFSLLGVGPGLGRFFLPDEDRTPGTHPVAVVSDAMWRKRLGAEENILGSTVMINNTAFTVVGVAPPGFVGLDSGRPCELWIPTMMAGVGSRWCDALTQRECRLFEMIGRLASGHTVESAQAEMATLSGHLHAAYPLTGDSVRGLEVTSLTGLDSERGRPARRIVALLLTVVTLVLVVASANLIGLMIGRGLTRHREIAVRLALGAPRQRVVSLFVAEALILTIAGGIGGLLVAGWASPLGTLVFQTRVPVEVEFTPLVLGYAALLCGLVGTVVGLVPGLQASRPDLISALKDVTGRGTSQRRLLAAFVIVQIAVSFVLLHSTGLLTRSMVMLTEAPSAEPENIATLRLHPRLVDYGPEQGETLVREVLRRIEALPGVRSVGFSKHRPLWPGAKTEASLPGSPPGAGASTQTTGLQPVGPRALESLGIALLRGRDFDRRDTEDAPPVLLVNKTLADNLWPGQDAVGQNVILREETHEVIGVVQDCAYRALIVGRSPQAFSAFWQDSSRPDARFAVRFEDEAEAYLPVLRKLVHGVDPAVPVTEVGTLKQQLERDLSRVKVASRLTGIVGALAVLLSAAGLSGVLALAVAQRFREFGIRRALGASQRQVMALVARDAMILVAPALTCGLIASAAAGPAIGQFLYGVHPQDPWMLGGALLAIAGAVAVGTLLPARRAGDVDPIVVLRR